MLIRFSEAFLSGFISLGQSVSRGTEDRPNRSSVRIEQISTDGADSQRSCPQRLPWRPVPISPSVVSEATTEEKLVAGFGVWRSLLIQRLEGSRPAVRADAVAMGFQ